MVPDLPSAQHDTTDSRGSPESPKLSTTILLNVVVFHTFNMWPASPVTIVSRQRAAHMMGFLWERIVAQFKN